MAVCMHALRGRSLHVDTTAMDRWELSQKVYLQLTNYNQVLLAANTL